MAPNVLAESPLLRKRISDSPQTLPTDDFKTRRLESQFSESATGSQESLHAERNGEAAPSPAGRRFIREINADRSQSSSPFRLEMPFITPGQLAFSALQFLPVPVLVLNNLKTVVLANEAMGRLLGMASESNDGDDLAQDVGSLTGQSLSQVGIDMLQNGRPVFIAWETFLDSIAEEMGRGQTQPADFQRRKSQGNHLEGDMTPIAESSGDSKFPGHSPQAAVEVVISRRDSNKPVTEPQIVNRASESQAFAKMIISVWDISDQQTYFTLTFTNNDSTSSVGSKRKAVARPSALESAERKTIFSTSNAPSVASSHGSSSSPSYRVSPGTVSLSSSPFPPMGPPFQDKSLQNAPSMLQKTMILKDALLDNTEVPILAMWKDGTVAFPNAAARRLMEKDATLDKPSDGLDVLSNWKLYTDDFSRELEPSEFPMGILLRTQTPFSDMRIGVVDRDGNRIRYNVLAEAIRDDETGEFLAGVITCRDVTEMAKEIDLIKARDIERFKLICDTMPQLVWTTTPDGYHDFFNTRWYNYTGLTPDECLGMEWKTPFHPDDMAETSKRWAHSLATGDPYVTEYRCLSKEGEWRWHLGRALPLRNLETGKIEKWFGTCTDVHESIETKLVARRMRQQLLSVITHANITIFTVDQDRKITMLEGALIWDANALGQDDSKWYIGGNVDEVFNSLNPELPEGERPGFLSAIDSIFSRRSGDVVVEHTIDSRFYRTRLLPVTDKKVKGEGLRVSEIEGVIGVIMDVTEIKAKEAVLQAQAQEKQQLLAREAAAKEASRLKSQFLANMSHEIRTPITGVIGMAELLLDVELNDEQRDYAENIYRSANALLTVINDILDFSKVESGRLDIEEVQFSMSVIVRDVAKMLSFAAQKRGLEFISDISPDVADDLVVLGDPGRVRQIITNLLTNSIKFTHQGFVKLSVSKERETDENIEIRFMIQDTGIGIDEGTRKRLFQPFSQGDASTARKFGGTGLGLTICKSLLELMHGRMQLDSVINQGTTAYFWVPFNKPHETQPSNVVRVTALPDRLQSEMSVSCNSSEFDQMGTPPPTELPGQSELGKSPRRKGALRQASSQEDLTTSERSKIHVLVVEDNPINQQIAIKTIKKLGFNVSAAWNGKEALEYLATAQDGQNRKPDIILMDVQMPVIDGYKATHLLRHHSPYNAYVRDVPIVAMTASAIQGDQEKCKKAGMDDYLAKPVKAKNLEKMLVRWSLNKRNGSIPVLSSDVSVCSEGSDNCTNTGIPSVSVQDTTGDEMFALPTMNEEADLDGIRSDLPTPRPKGSPPPAMTTPSPTEPPTEPPSPGKPQLHIRRVETDELAQASRDDKLFDAAGGPPSAVTPHGHTPLTEKGDSLTEANVEKFQREELRRQISSDKV
ncbi:hsp90-like protein [Diaporthe helianthi]|uniref:histidine kinase n=1 Tax=Diaporthe helianthi TaxID=158607 RepID=A0A2P5I1I1_DIAHE|nr:hsp90-like protein [Diaporthe helianthi]